MAACRLLADVDDLSVRMSIARIRSASSVLVCPRRRSRGYRSGSAGTNTSFSQRIDFKPDVGQSGLQTEIPRKTTPARGSVSEALEKIEDEIHVRRLILAAPTKSTDLAAQRTKVRDLMVTQHKLMVERSAAAVIERRLATA